MPLFSGQKHCWVVRSIVLLWYARYAVWSLFTLACGTPYKKKNTALITGVPDKSGLKPEKAGSLTWHTEFLSKKIWGRTRRQKTHVYWSLKTLPLPPDSERCLEHWITNAWEVLFSSFCLHGLAVGLKVFFTVGGDLSFPFLNVCPTLTILEIKASPLGVVTLYSSS